MYSYAKKFPKEIIPHVNEAKEINDIIHNYQRLKPSTQNSFNKASDPDSKKMFDLEAQKVNTALSQATPNLTEEVIQTAQREIQETSTSKLIGLIAHLAYWNVFGHFNKLPLDMYHRKQMFISIATIRSQLDLKYQGKRFYYVFLVPMLVLAIRIEVELIFKNSYPKFFTVDIHEKIAMK